MPLKQFVTLFVFGLLHCYAHGVENNNMANVPGTYARTPKTLIDVQTVQDKNFPFTISIFENLDNLCSLEGNAKMIDPFRASAIYNDCFLVFNFDPKHTQVKINTKGCAQTCKGKVQTLVDGIYSKQ